MASYGGHAMPAAGQRHGHRSSQYAAAAGVSPAIPVVAAGPAAPAGTFTPGTKIQVGSHRVVIQKYLSEGGFAHVYLVKLPTPVSGTDLAVLKRVAVPDKESLRAMRTEVETMKRLKGHRAIVTYIDSHASELLGGGYEVFLLMEYCDGGGLIDFMNTRLQHRLTEPEILQIFTDVAEGVACMHYLKPPLLHRDLKVENVLITHYGKTRKFKLCDFGSAAQPKPAPTTVVECRAMDEDVQKHTTLQYRSPEMIDVYRKQPIDEKSDIWALGVLLYKLCYYTTPFEDQGQLAILNASFKYPSYPAFSDRLKRLIAVMLKESQQARPNIYEVLREGCSMQGREPPIKDIYTGRVTAEPRKETRAAPAAASAASPEKASQTPVVGASFAPISKQQQAIPDVVPMRRGRLPSSQPAQAQAQAQSLPQQASTKPSRSPMRVTNGDPFAALDSNSKFGALGLESDELSSKFPTLDQFSLLHDQGSNFSFDDAPVESSKAKDLSQKVAQRLADEAFSPPPSKPPQQFPVAEQAKAQVVSPPLPSVSAPARTTEMSRASAIIAATPELQAISSPESQASFQPGFAPAAKPSMVSTGTMTSTPPPERQYQIHRFPPTDQHRSASVPRVNEASTNSRSLSATPSLQATATIPLGSTYSSQPAHGRQPSSSRPSLEGGRPSTDFLDSTSRFAAPSNVRQRPVSTHLESHMDYLRDRERSPKPLLSPGLPSPGKNAEATSSSEVDAQDETNITSNVEFLRSMEDSKDSKSGSHHHHHKHGKRSSLSSLSGTKNILAGKFGDAFKRFESNTTSGPPPARTPSPLKHLGRGELTPIAGSEATDGRSDDGEVLEETDDMTPEMRREIERRRLSMEEKRVAAAGAEYRRKVAQREEPTYGGGGGTGATALPKSIGGVSRAFSIQNKVQNLLDNSRSSTTVTRTASGYGHFTDSGLPNTPASGEVERPEVPRKPVAGVGMARVSSQQSRQQQQPPPPQAYAVQGVTANPAERPVAGGQRGPPPPVGNKPDMPPPSMPTARLMTPSASGRPMAPPKPIRLNNLTGGGTGRPASPPKPAPLRGVAPPGGLPPPQRSATSAAGATTVLVSGQTLLDLSPQERDGYVRDFSKRFPSLSSVELGGLSTESAAGGMTSSGGGGGS